MAATSNAKQLTSGLRDLILSFGFDKTVEGRSVGRDCVGIVADGIAARSIDEQRGPDAAWAENSPQYAEFKKRRYGSDRIGVRTGQMLSVTSLIGDASISTHDVQMMYGVGDPPTRSATGKGFDPDTDGVITDIEKAFFFSKTRPFYFLDDGIADLVLERLEGCVTVYLTTNW